MKDLSLSLLLKNLKGKSSEPIVNMLTADDIVRAIKAKRSQPEVVEEDPLAIPEDDFEAREKKRLSRLFQEL